MAPDSLRRAALGIGGAFLALTVTLLLQSALLRANTNAAVAEDYAIIVGIAVAVPLLQSAAQPAEAVQRGVRVRVAGTAMLASLLVGVLVVTVLRSLSLFGNVLVVAGAAAAYAAGTVVRSYLFGLAEETEMDGDDEAVAE